MGGLFVAIFLTQQVAPNFLIRAFDGRARSNEGKKIALLYIVLIAANALAWLWALVQFGDHAVLLGTASLAYTFGLRHAVDPDHIAAIADADAGRAQADIAREQPLSIGSAARATDIYSTTE